MKLAVVAGALVIAALSARGDEPAAATALDFTYDVLPVLQRHGCASAYCHGGATGQGGFKLSLFGSDPAADHAAIATEFGGRRIDRDDPDRSLLVAKALGKLDHGGGRRVERDGEAHQRLRVWIAAGAPWRQGAARELEGLALTRRGDQLVVEATFAGERVDVTDRALFASTEPRVAEVDERGRVQEVGPGRTFLVARLGNTTTTLAVTRGFGDVRNAVAAAASHGEHPLDRTWRQHLGELGLAPAPRAAATRLARRVHLDMVGRPPTPQELDRFVAAPDVRAVVLALAARPEFAAVWGGVLADWLAMPADDAEARGELVAAIARGDTLPELVRQLAGGELPGLQRQQDPRDRAEQVARTLLGMRIGCARCHDHPDDRWRQHEHLAFSAAFAPRASAAGTGWMPPGMVYDAATGRPVVPQWLALPGNRTRAGDGLAAFLLDRGHQQLARHLGNRLFATLLGRGLVEPVDDHRPSNPPLHAGMLAALVAEFERVDGKLADVLAFVMTSQLYATEAVADDDPRGRWLAARRVLPLPEATFARAVGAVVGRDPRGVLPHEPLARELALRNGAFVRNTLVAGGTTIDALFELGGGERERLDELWRTVLSRLPTDDEVAAFAPLAAQDLAAFRDMAMALLLGREFGQRR